MPKSFDVIISEINKHLGNISNYSAYYVGITNDVERRLFNEHKVDREHGKWIYRTATSDTVARDVEQYFLNKGCKGGSGGGDESSIIVYCYKITNNTVE